MPLLSGIGPAGTKTNLQNFGVILSIYIWEGMGGQSIQEI